MCVYLRDWVCEKEEKQWLSNFLEGREQGLILSLYFSAFYGSLRQLLSYNHGYTEKQKQLQIFQDKSKAVNPVDY